jgi:large subunit ribosomal protein L22
MEAKAKLQHCRMSPRKVQIVLDLIRGQDLDKAIAILKYTPRSACEPVLKLVNSAAANAEHNFEMDKGSLYVSECFATPGPTLKRIRPRAKGSASRIFKRASHITVVVEPKSKEA